MPSGDGGLAPETIHVRHRWDINGDYKASGLKAKFASKKTMRSQLPRGLLKHPKTGFGLPLARWLASSEMDGLKELLLSRETEEHGFFARRGLERFFEEHEPGRDDHSSRILRLAVFELWLTKVCDRTREKANPTLP